MSSTGVLKNGSVETSGRTPAKAQTKTKGRGTIRGSAGLRSALLIGPAAIYLFIWMIVPLAMTIFYSFRRYNLQLPTIKGFAGWANYANILTDSDFLDGLLITLIIVVACLVITVVVGLAFAVLYNSDHVFGSNLLRTLAASPFFIMPVVSGLIWKDLLLNPSFGLVAALQRGLGLTPYSFLSKAPLVSIIGIVSWEWIPFAMLVLLASLSGISEEIKEAAYLDGAGAWKTFRHIILPQLGRPLYAVVMLETIFFLIIFGQIYVATSGGPGNSSTNLPYYIYLQAFSSYDIGAASACAVFAIILANIVAIFLVRMISANIREEA
jgi:sorbitol/mannitol transport system permease protein